MATLTAEELAAALVVDTAAGALPTGALPADPVEALALIDAATNLLRDQMARLADVRAGVVAGVVSREGSIRAAGRLLGLSVNAVHRASKRPGS